MTNDTATPTYFDVDMPTPAELLRRKLVAVVRQYADSKPRNKQVLPGASGLGNPCDRQLALRAVGAPTTDTPQDPWAAAVGTAVHKWLQNAFNAYWPADGTDTTWTVEQEMAIGAGITGQADLYGDGYVIDHKVPGDYMLDKVRSCTCAPEDLECPHISRTYKTQAHLYGYGLTQVGVNVHSVAIAFWPRGKNTTLDGVHVWLDDYRPAIAEAALKRWQDILNAAIQLDLEHHLDRASLFATADGPCAWCPFYDWRNNGGVCQGHRPST